MFADRFIGQNSAAPSPKRDGSSRKPQSASDTQAVMLASATQAATWQRKDIMSTGSGEMQKPGVTGHSQSLINKAKTLDAQLFRASRLDHEVCGIMSPRSYASNQSLLPKRRSIHTSTSRKCMYNFTSLTPFKGTGFGTEVKEKSAAMKWPGKSLHPSSTMKVTTVFPHKSDNLELLGHSEDKMRDLLIDATKNRLKSFSIDDPDSQAYCTPNSEHRHHSPSSHSKYVPLRDYTMPDFMRKSGPKGQIGKVRYSTNVV